MEDACRPPAACAGAANTPAALEKLLPLLKEKGFSFIPVSELIYQENYHIDHEGKQISNK